MLKKILLLLLGLFLLAAAALAYLAWDLDQFLNRPIEAEKTFVYQVRSGATVRGIEDEFVRMGVLSRSHYFSSYARYFGLAEKIKKGEYQVEVHLTPPQLLDLLVSGKVIQYSLTLVEGWNFKQMMSAVDNNSILEHELKGLSKKEIMQRLGYAGVHPEGRFYPDTYAFTRGTSDLSFLKRSYNKMSSVLEREWQKRQKKLPLKSAYEALILASIVERETAAVQERPKIAGVFIRRLRKKMRLQTDPTVIYGMGDRYDGNIRRRDLTADTPYNTYTRSGLTPTPIAMPSGDAIRAVLHPDEDGSLYFVAKGDGSGEHDFSKTLIEHNKAVARYLKRLRQNRRKNKK
ncbi:MAG: endolytic transglycosylase MltG [Gammaproteobacteria bacterium]|nr:endolytic transglycosylase MltG [Gammaproteobacteria bacterium]